MDDNKIGLMPKASKKKNSTSGDYSSQLSILESFKEMVENGQVEEFIIAGLDGDNQIVLASHCGDIITGLGVLEMGKYALMNQQAE